MRHNIYVNYDVFFFWWWASLNPKPCIFYALSQPTELSSRVQDVIVLALLKIDFVLENFRDLKKK